MLRLGWIRDRLVTAVVHWGDSGSELEQWSAEQWR